MATPMRRTASTLTRIPPLTAGTIALALLALPTFVLVLGILDWDVHPVVTIVVSWTFAITVVGVAVGGEGLQLSDIGFRRPAWIDLAYIVATSVAILLVYGLTEPLVTELGLPVRADANVLGAGVGAGVALAQAVTTGVVEEILYRGYPIERLLAYTDSPIIAGGLTWGIFTAAHAVNWPLGNLVQTALVAGVLTVVYLRRRTLAPVVGAHVLVWVVAVLGQA